MAAGAGEGQGLPRGWNQWARQLARQACRSGRQSMNRRHQQRPCARIIGAGKRNRKCGPRVRLWRIIAAIFAAMAQWCAPFRRQQAGREASSLAWSVAVSGPSPNTRMSRMEKPRRICTLSYTTLASSHGWAWIKHIPSHTVEGSSISECYVGSLIAAACYDPILRGSATVCSRPMRSNPSFSGRIRHRYLAVKMSRKDWHEKSWSFFACVGIDNSAPQRRMLSASGMGTG